MKAGSNPPPSPPPPRAIWRDTTLVAVLVLFALIFWGLRLRYWSITHEEPFSDIGDYVRIAQQISRNLFFGDSEHYYSFWTPVTPSFIALSMLLGGDQYQWVCRFIVQSTTFIATLALGYELAKLTGRRWLGLALLFVVAICRPSIFWSLKIGTESVSEALLLASIALGLRTIRTNSPLAGFFAGAVCLLLALNRPQFFPSVVVAAGFLILGAIPFYWKAKRAGMIGRVAECLEVRKVPPWFDWATRGNRRRMLTAACFVLGVALTWSPWLVRNYSHYGALVPFGTSGFDTFIWEYGGQPIRPGRYTELPYGDGKVLREFGLQKIQAELEKLPNDFERWKEVRSIAIAWLAANWMDVPRLMVWRLKRYVTHNGANGLTKVPREQLFPRGPSSYNNPVGETSTIENILIDKTPWAVVLALCGSLLLLWRNWLAGGVILSLWLLPWPVLSFLIGYERTVESLISFTLWLALYFVAEAVIRLSRTAPLQLQAAASASGPAAADVSAASPQIPGNYGARSSTLVEEDVVYGVQITQNYLKLFDQTGINLRGLRMLELGPGVNFAPQLVMASMGAQIAVADRFLTKWNVDYHPAFYRAFKERWGGSLPAIDRVLAAGDHVQDAIGTYEQPAEAMTAIPSGSVDLVISNAVLEHVYSMPDVAKELARVTRPGGRSMHQIDFRDHRDFKRPLEFLTMPDDEFAREFAARHGECGNRLRASEVQAIFEQNGFELIDFEINDRARPDYFDDVLPRLRGSRSRYRDWPEQDLRVLSGRMLFERKRA
ncbi:MAG TPA: methyltransferase domain-containing protein [Xanthobacteraceae bacterium]|nr:methyltransferase domain-containing protein [Xanthobacteraceae bacterium]